MRSITNAVTCLLVTAPFLLMPALILARTEPEKQGGDLPGLTAETAKSYSSALRQIKAGKENLDVGAAQEVVEQIKAAHGQDSELLATAIVYLGFAQLSNDDAMLALDSFERAVTLIENSAGPFGPGLVSPLQGMAMSHIRLENYQAAEVLLRRAQHVTHRHQGIYNADQLEIVDKLIEVDKITGNNLEIDREQFFYLKVHENLYGKDDPRIVPALLRLGKYLASRAPMLRARHYNFQYTMKRRNYFNQSFEFYQRAISIIEENYGETDLRLIEPLRGLAQAKFAKGFGKQTATASLRRVVDVIKANPGSDVGDVARATVDLGDLYTRWNDMRAKEAYREAWNAIPDESIYQNLRDELFAAPVRLAPDSIDIKLRRRPWHDDNEIFSELSYIVRADGRAGRFVIVDGNVPVRASRLLRSKLRNARFRPRVVDGEVVRTEGLILHQQFQLVN